MSFKKLILLFITLITLGIGAALLYTKSYLQENITTPKLLHIEKGSTKSSLDDLKSKGLDIGFLDYYLIKRYGYPQAGWIEFNTTTLTRERFLYAITHLKAATRNITLIPGETTEIFLETISKRFSFDLKKLKKSYKKYAPYPDGVLFANSYNVPIGMNEDQLMLHLVTLSLKRHKKISLKELGDYEQKTWFEKIVTKASIVQKEAANSEEMPVIAGVIENRLKKGMPLQMDGTLNYGKYSHTKVTPKRIKDDNSAFNTYKNRSLPPYPICSVSKSAIISVIHPKKTKYLYFVRGKDGSHIFSSTYKDHKKHIK